MLIRLSKALKIIGKSEKGKKKMSMRYIKPLSWQSLESCILPNTHRDMETLTYELLMRVMTTGVGILERNPALSDYIHIYNI